MRKKYKVLLLTLCVAALALNGCAKNANSEVQAVILLQQLLIRVSL